MVSVLALDENTKLSNKLTTTLKENISEYLSDYRMLNDYIDIGDGKVLNLGFEVDLFVEKGASKSEVVGGVSNVIREYMDINKWDMGDNIYLSQLIENIK